MLNPLSLRRRNSHGWQQLPAHLAPVLRRLYAARGMTSDEVELALPRLLPPDALLGIDAAVAILADAMVRNLKILIAADYDADGATACAVAVRGLRALGARQVQYLVPDRFTMGYGLSVALVDAAAARGAQLILTVDNGIASVAGVAHAKALGISVVITDHHLPGPQLPQADACVNPNQPGCGFASKNLAGVGVMFYVLLALRATLRRQDYFASTVVPNFGELLDLVALGTVADLVKLDYNNRILVDAGLRRIRQGKARKGIGALLHAAGRAPEQISALDLGFVLGPRLNAAGRLDDMTVGIECLLADDEEKALSLAHTLDSLNRQRRALQTHMSEQALQITEQSSAFGVVAMDKSWHEGIVGLVASKLKDAHHRPAIAFAPSLEPGWLKGSARSIEGLHVRDALAAVDAQAPGVIERFGGHAMAAGLTIKRDQYENFCAQFDRVCALALAPAMLQRVVETDGELAANELSLETAALLETAQPWGQGFAAPVFEGRFLVLAVRMMGAEQQHVRYDLSLAAKQKVQAVHFFVGEQLATEGQVFTFAYTLGINRYQGKESLQLIIQHACL